MKNLSFRVAFLTGHSVNSCTGLSKEQVEFQKQTWVSIQDWHPWNFPFTPSFSFPEDYPLPLAALNNVQHFLSAQQKGFSAKFSSSVMQEFASFDRIIIFSSSCGLELLSKLQLPENFKKRLYVFACGPVSIGTPECRSLFVLQGKQDYLSRIFHRKADFKISCGHMDYLKSPRTLELFDSFCRRSLQ